MFSKENLLNVSPLLMMRRIIQQKTTATQKKVTNSIDNAINRNQFHRLPIKSSQYNDIIIVSERIAIKCHE
jgi:hypothetical protein